MAHWIVKETLHVLHFVEADTAELAKTIVECRSSRDFDGIDFEKPERPVVVIPDPDAD